FIDLNGTLFFTAAESRFGNRSLWTTDGTAAGTVKVEDGYVGMLHERDGELLFARSTAAPGAYSLWKSDGTAGAAVELPRAGTGASNATPGQPTEVNGTLYFAANDGVHGNELWKMVGDTPVMDKDLNPGRSGT